MEAANWPGGKKGAILFNVCLEAWSDGKAPGIGPMGNPLPPHPGVLDTNAISWAEYGAKRGIYRLIEGLDRHGVKASVMVNAVLAERHPQAIRAVAQAGHEVLSHSYAMDVIPVLLSEEVPEPDTTPVAIRILGGVETSFWTLHLSEDIMEGLLSHMQILFFPSCLKGFKIGSRKKGIIIKHLFEMGNKPSVIHRIAMEPSSEMVVDPAFGHLLQCQFHHPQSLFRACPFPIS